MEAGKSQVVDQMELLSLSLESECMKVTFESLSLEYGREIVSSKKKMKLCHLFLCSSSVVFSACFKSSIDVTGVPETSAVDSAF